jgi:hypothetical protein
MLGIEKAFIQANIETGLPLDETAFAVWSGCRVLDIKPVLYKWTRDIEGELTKNTLVHGGVPHVLAALRLLEVPIPTVSDYPTPLFKFLGRHVIATTIGYLRNRTTSLPVFVKPRGGTKLFNGFIYTGSIEDQIRLNTFENDTLTWESQVVNFVSEYRVLIHQGLIFACRHYKGDCSVFPNMDVATQAIQRFKDAPVGYSLDLGVTDDGRTLLVEVNDAWALGAYGTPSIPYTEMIVNRWKEMVS